MRMLLPPSETKRDGGDRSAPLDLTRLSFPSLTTPRTVAVDALRALSRDPSAMSVALRLGPRNERDVLRNQSITVSPTMPALDRYTGVLFDGLGAASLSPVVRRFAARSIVVHSALFGLVGADDALPAYRLSHDSRLPALRLAQLWRAAVSAELDAFDGLVLDLRSDAYAALGPVPAGSHRYVVRVMAESAHGTRRALSHDNKRAKGEFARAVLMAGNDHPDARSLLAWAEESGIRLDHGQAGELELTIEQPARSRTPVGRG